MSQHSFLHRLLLVCPPFLLLLLLSVCLVAPEENYAFIILRARHDHNKTAPCGIIKAFLNLNLSKAPVYYCVLVFRRIGEVFS